MHVHGHGLSMEFIWDGDVLALLLRGDLDRRSAPLLARTLDALRDQRLGNMSVNIAGIECIDTAGAQLLLGAGQRAREGGCEFLIRSPSTTVGRALEAHAHAEAAAPAGARRDDSVSCIAVVGEA